MNRLALALIVLAGCYRTRFELQPPVGYAVPSPLYTDHFHFSLIGIFEVSAPVDLSAACNGTPPAAIDEYVGVIGAIINIFLSDYLPILHVHNATVLCPAGNGPPPPGGPMGPPGGPMGPPPSGPPGGPPGA